MPWKETALATFPDSLTKHLIKVTQGSQFEGTQSIMEENTWQLEWGKLALKASHEAPTRGQRALAKSQINS